MASGYIYTVAGPTSGTSGVAGDGGPATSALLDSPGAVALDASGDIYVADTLNDRVQELSATTGSQWGQAMTKADVYTVSGSAAGASGDAGDGGPAVWALLDEPGGVAVGPSGDLYVADTGNNVVREALSLADLVAAGGPTKPKETAGGANPSEPNDPQPTFSSADARGTGVSVDAATGELDVNVEDLSVPGRGEALDLARTYSSTVASQATGPGPFGYGWTGSYSMEAVPDPTYGPSVMDIVQENGSVTQFVETATGTWAGPARAQAAYPGPSTTTTTAQTATTATTPLLWAGQYQDPTTGLYYMRARWYDPGTGEFLSVDPDLDSTLDAYGYADENPIDGSDPSGLATSLSWVLSVVKLLTASGAPGASSAAIVVAAAATARSATASPGAEAAKVGAALTGATSAASTSVAGVVGDGAATAAVEAEGATTREESGHQGKQPPTLLLTWADSGLMNVVPGHTTTVWSSTKWTVHSTTPPDRPGVHIENCVPVVDACRDGYETREIVTVYDYGDGYLAIQTEQQRRNMSSVTYQGSVTVTGTGPIYDTSVSINLYEGSKQVASIRQGPGIKSTVYLGGFYYGDATITGNLRGWFQDLCADRYAHSY
jgi:RHS repeat-associated protein